MFVFNSFKLSQDFVKTSTKKKEDIFRITFILKQILGYKMWSEFVFENVTSVKRYVNSSSLTKQIVRTNPKKHLGQYLTLKTFLM